MIWTEKYFFQLSPPILPSSPFLNIIWSQHHHQISSSKPEAKIKISLGTKKEDITFKNQFFSQFNPSDLFDLFLIFNDVPTFLPTWDFFEDMFLAFLPETSFVAIDSYLFPVSTKTFFESPTRERNTFISVELFNQKVKQISLQIVVTISKELSFALRCHAQKHTCKTRRRRKTMKLRVKEKIIMKYNYTGSQKKKIFPLYPWHFATLTVVFGWEREGEENIDGALVAHGNVKSSCRSWLPTNKLNLGLDHNHSGVWVSGESSLSPVVC